MDKNETLDPNQAGESGSASSHDPARATARESAASPTPRTRPRGLFHRLLARWWQILLFWLVVYLSVAYVLLQFVRPTYEASSLLRVEPRQPGLLEPIREDFVDPRFVKPYLQTQLNVITSNRVLTEAIADPLVNKLPTIMESKDPAVDLRKKMVAEIVGDANVIRVALELANGADAATIVNAVVRSYLKYNAEYERGANSRLKANLDKQLQIFEQEIKLKTSELGALYKKGTFELGKPPLTVSASKNNSDMTQPTFSTVTEEHVQRLVDQMVKTDLELIEAQATLAARQASNAQPLLPDATLEDRVMEEFRRGPEIIAVIGELGETEDELDRLKERVGKGNDPALRAAQKHHKQLTERYDNLWASSYDEIKKRLIQADGSLQAARDITELRIRVAALSQKKAEQAKLFDNLKIEKKRVNNDTFAATFLDHEINSLLAGKEKIKSNLRQLEFAASQETHRVILVDDAKAPKNATNDKLLGYLAVASGLSFLLILGVYLVGEMVAGRKAAPQPA
jgi:uncharacterized protein involved in exopolysaccharide biosynthesis